MYVFVCTCFLSIFVFILNRQIFIRMLRTIYVLVLFTLVKTKDELSRRDALCRLVSNALMKNSFLKYVRSHFLRCTSIFVINREEFAFHLNLSTELQYKNMCQKTQIFYFCKDCEKFN